MTTPSDTPRVTSATLSNVWSDIETGEIAADVDNPPEMPDKPQSVKINDVSPETRYLWELAVRKLHGKYQGAASDEGEKALRDWALHILYDDYDSATNRDIMRRLDELEARLIGESDLHPTFDDEGDVNKKISDPNEEPAAEPNTTPEPDAENGKKHGVETYERITAENSLRVDWTAFKGVYEHDVVISPNADADWTDEDGKSETWTDRLTRGKQHRLPVLVGMLNWARETNELEYSVNKSEVTRAIMEWLDVSRQSAYNYRDALLDEGALTPTPIYDPDLYLQEESELGGDTRFEVTVSGSNENLRDIMITGMADEGNDAVTEDYLRGAEQSRWPGAEACFEEVAEHWLRDYYVTVTEDVRRCLWRDVKRGIQAVAEHRKKKGRKSPRQVTEWDKACAVAEFNSAFAAALREAFRMQEDTVVHLLRASITSSNRNVDGSGEWRVVFKAGWKSFEALAFGYWDLDDESAERDTTDARVGQQSGDDADEDGVDDSTVSESALALFEAEPVTDGADDDVQGRIEYDPDGDAARQDNE